MFKCLNLDNVFKRIDEGYRITFLIGSNNTTILRIGKIEEYSLKKEDFDKIKLYLEIEGKDYEEIPYDCLKYSNVLEKYAKNDAIWLFQTFFVGEGCTYSPFDFKTNKIEWKYYPSELFEAAKKFNYTIHLNEKPSSWTQYSNNL